MKYTISIGLIQEYNKTRRFFPKCAVVSTVVVEG